ncbi:MAG TPA: glycoside hydrolase family 5 protein [Candidatus Saccharimonadales bacterium]|nr:glycoside hydrolase family 5 protein [Candidatus Saccharimonadales bacterium]
MWNKIFITLAIPIIYVGLFVFIRFITQQGMFDIQSVNASNSIAFSGLRVVKNKLVNEQNQQVVLHGADRSGAEYECVKNDFVFDGPSDEVSIQAMKTWNITAIRVPLNEDCWLGINGAKVDSSTYQKAIRNYVTLLNQHQIYVILDLHWNAPGDTLSTSQQNMADRDHSIDFWKSVAATFKGNNNVLFDVYNEPHDISWDCWKNGCDNYAGMQQLVDAVRSTGANNVIMLGGLNWAKDLSGWYANRPTDPKNNLVASWHMYGSTSCSGTNCWDAKGISSLMAKVPVIAGEFGESSDATICSTPISNAFMNWMDQHNSSYLAWTWDAWGTSCGDLSLITAYNGTPHKPNGINYRNHLLALKDEENKKVDSQAPTSQKHCFLFFCF